MAVVSDQVREYKRFLFQKRLTACGKHAMNRVQHPLQPSQFTDISHARQLIRIQSNKTPAPPVYTPLLTRVNTPLSGSLDSIMGYAATTFCITELPFPVK
jgi:hypothetical protein